MKADAKKYVESLKKKEEAAVKELRSKVELLTKQNAELTEKAEAEKRQLKLIAEELCTAKEETKKVSTKRCIDDGSYCG